jgi:flagellin-like protein
MKTKDKGEMGVGTLIIFIAVILVAAVAAALLVSTANSLENQRIQSSGSTYEPYNSSSSQESLPPEPPGTQEIP